MVGIEGFQNVVFELLNIDLVAEFVAAVFADCFNDGIPFRLGKVQRNGPTFLRGGRGISAESKQRFMRLHPLAVSAGSDTDRAQLLLYFAAR